MKEQQMAKRSKNPRSRDRQATRDDRDFISVTEVEERYFPKLSQREKEEQPLDVETRRKAEDALADIQSGMVTGTVRRGPADESAKSPRENEKRHEMPRLDQQRNPWSDTVSLGSPR
jgi:hypothetical protein